MSLARSLMASSMTMLSSLRTGAASCISIRLSRSMLVSLPLGCTVVVVLQGVDDVDDALFLARVALGQHLGDGAGRGEARRRLPCMPRKLRRSSSDGQVGRIADRHGQDAVLVGQRQHLVDGGHRLGDQRAAPRAVGLSFLEVERPCRPNWSARACMSWSSVIRPRRGRPGRCSLPVFLASSRISQS